MVLAGVVRVISTQCLCADAKADVAGHAGVPPVIDPRFLQADGSGMLLQQFHSGVPPAGGSRGQRTKPELSAAADVLLQMSGSPSSNMPISLAPPEQVRCLQRSVLLFALCSFLCATHHRLLSFSVLVCGQIFWAQAYKIA